MKKIVVQFEMPDSHDQDEVLDTIMGCVYDNDRELSNTITYTILERK